MMITIGYYNYLVPRLYILDENYIVAETYIHISYLHT